MALALAPTLRERKKEGRPGKGQLNYKESPPPLLFSILPRPSFLLSFLRSLVRLVSAAAAAAVIAVKAITQP